MSSDEYESAPDSDDQVEKASDDDGSEPADDPASEPESDESEEEKPKKKSSSKSSSKTSSSSTAKAPAPAAAAPAEASVPQGRKDDDESGSDGWSDDENPKKMKLSKRQYKKDRKDELGRIFDRGNFRDEVCGTIDVTLVLGRELLLNKKTGKSPGGRGLFVKCVVSFPKTDPVSSELAVTEEDGDVTWQFLFPSMLVYQKSGNVANAFFKYPRLLFKVYQKGTLLSKTISRGELPLGPVIAPKPPTDDEEEDPLKPNADGECVVPMLTTSRVRQGELVVRVKYRAGVQQRRPV